MQIRAQIPEETPAPHQRARGVGELTVSAGRGKTNVARLYQSGCAKIRTPRTTGAGLEAIMINSSGGMTGGDRLEWTFNVGAEACATITSQACERVYRSVADTARSDIELTVAAGGRLSWLPQETILFNEANLTRTIHADLDENSEALFVEPVIFGRHAMGETITNGHLRDRWRIKQGRQLIHSEDLNMSGDISSLISQPFALSGNGAMATVLLISASAEGYLTSARNLIATTDGVSAWNGKLLARVMAKDGYLLRKKLVPLLNLLNFEAQVPKVWSL